MGDSPTNRGSVPGRVAGLMVAYAAALDYLLDHGVNERKAWMDATGLRSFEPGPYPPSVAVAVICLSQLVRAEAHGEKWTQRRPAWSRGKETITGQKCNARYAGATFVPNFEHQDLVQK